ncbi:DUF4290 domain-containing protein [Alkalitalea saponilacus]|uniref:DUF4290 domain-containing protein n=1 Tax=Alkalitalea saponilacus TaxID=889453 RepID=A0A1T5AWT4_9BACT|nr:DUF4290 domain-containing protein [Alkalitalea saponilacus]ASB48577.1 hypothetical protein CDL62_05200 [Alkalitalea saponilacus]SKB39083.1 protein of unknown function [Alkalitalea saponilacus]
MDYNSTRKPLVLPEYGRHIHKMVDHAKTIEDREERTKCAQAIVSVMGNLFPHLRDVSDFKHKLWDHLAIMSDFQLDIDFPYEFPEAVNFSSKPDNVPYNDFNMRYRHYGRLIEQMIAKAVDMEEGDLKNHLIGLLSNHMRKSLLNWNKDHATDDRIINDIRILSGGKLEVTPQQLRLPDTRDNQNRGPRKKHFQRNKGRD